MDNIPDVTDSTFWEGRDDFDRDKLCREFALKVRRLTRLPINVSKLEVEIDNAIGNAIKRSEVANG